MTKVTLERPILCVRCNRHFKATIQAKTEADGGELWSFRCTHCRHVYEMARISARGVEIREEIDRLEKGRPRPARAERIAKLREELAAETTRRGEAAR